MTIKNYFSIFLFVAVLTSCSSDADNDTERVNQPEPPTEVTLQAFEQPYAYVNDQVTLVGTNFTTNASDIKVLLDDIEATLISATSTQLTFTIPAGTSASPFVAIEMPNTNVSYADTYQPIAVVDNTKGEWITYPFYLEAINAVRNIQATGKEEIYFSTEAKREEGGGTGIMKVHNTLNGGVSIAFFNQAYAFTEENGDFLVGPQGGEFLLGSNYLSYLKVDGTQTIFEDFPSNVNSWTRGLFVDENEQTIIVGSAEGRIYKSTNGAQSFDMIHSRESNNYEFLSFYAHSENQVWLAGYTFPFPENLDYYPAKQLRLKDGVWEDSAVEIEPGNRTRERIERIKFIDGVTGYAAAYIVDLDTGAEKYVLIKSINGGDSYEIVLEEDTRIDDFTFKNPNEGWYIAGNQIFTTTDGGSSWQLMHTTTMSCKGILYNDGILWVIADNMLLKYYF